MPGSTVTASRTSRPSWAVSAAVTIGRRRVSRTSLVKSLGAAMRAVSSTRPRGRVRETKARCCGVRVPSPNDSKALAQRSVSSAAVVSTYVSPRHARPTLPTSCPQIVERLAGRLQRPSASVGRPYWVGRLPDPSGRLWMTQEPGGPCCGSRMVGVDLITSRATGTLMRLAGSPVNTTSTTRTEQEPGHVEAHLPAQQPSSGAHAWLPRSHAHPRRPRHPRCAPRQGTRPPVGLTFAVP